ncbi:MAG: DUF6429 family protein [Rhodopila sp.]|nr:DUF6429 family protein [Rhodopila sp.]
MDIDKDKIDEAVPALLWKSQDWDAMDRLYEKEMIDDPSSENRSVWFNEEGLAESGRLFEKLLGKPGDEE